MNITSDLHSAHLANVHLCVNVTYTQSICAILFIRLFHPPVTEACILLLQPGGVSCYGSCHSPTHPWRNHTSSTVHVAEGQLGAHSRTAQSELLRPSTSGMLYYIILFFGMFNNVLHDFQTLFNINSRIFYYSMYSNVLTHLVNP